MGKTTLDGEYAESLLRLIFNGTPYANMADNAAVAPFSSLYVSLHIQSPGPNGNQSTSEASFGNYARVSVPRTSGGWTVLGNVVYPANLITFPPATGSPNQVLTYMGIGTNSVGAGHLLYFAPVSPPIVIDAAGVQGELTPGSTISEI